MDIINNVIEEVQYIRYEYSTNEERESHIIEMEKNEYECLYKLSDGLEVTYRKILGVDYK